MEVPDETHWLCSSCGARTYDLEGWGINPTTPPPNANTTAQQDPASTSQAGTQMPYDGA